MRPVRADADRDATRAQLARRRDAAAEAQVAAGIVRNHDAVMRHARHVVVIQPDTMRHRHVRSQKADFVQMGGQRLAVAAQAAHGLGL